MNNKIDWLLEKPEIEKLLKENFTIKQISKKYNIDSSYFSKIIKKLGLHDIYLGIKSKKNNPKKSIEHLLKRYTNRNLKNTKEFLIKNLTENVNFKQEKGILLKEDFIEQYFKSREASNKPIYNYDFSFLPDIIKNKNEKVKIFVNEISTKTNKIIGKWHTNYKEFITNLKDNRSLSGINSKTKTDQYINTEKFISRSIDLFGENSFGYDKTNYVNNHTPVKLLCLNCGNYFEQKPIEHYNSKGCCPECSMKLAGLKKTTPINKIKEKIIGVYGNESWDLDSLEYTNLNSKISIKDKETGILYTRSSIYAFLENDPRNNKKSKGEILVKNWLDCNNISNEEQYRLIGVNGRNSNYVIVDFFLKELNTFIEVNGIQHYKFDEKSEFFGNKDDFRKQLKRDENLRSYCTENNIRLLEIPYTYLENENNLYNLLSEIILENKTVNIVYPKIKGNE